MNLSDVSAPGLLPMLCSRRDRTLKYAHLGIEGGDKLWPILLDDYTPGPGPIIIITKFSPKDGRCAVGVL